MRDYTGQRFFRLTAIRRIGVTKKWHQIWLFMCDCGSKKRALVSNVKSGGIKSCGCLLQDYRDNAFQKLKKKWTGKEFPFWKIVDIEKKQHRAEAVIMCKECGFKRSVCLSAFLCYNHGNREHRECRWRKIGKTSMRANYPVAFIHSAHVLGIPFDELKKTYPDWRNMKSKYKRVSFSNGKWWPNKRARYIEIMGMEKTLTEWGAFLGLTRERARQLANAGSLHKRVRDKLSLH